MSPESVPGPGTKTGPTDSTPSRRVIAGEGWYLEAAMGDETAPTTKDLLGGFEPPDAERMLKGLEGI